MTPPRRKTTPTIEYRDFVEGAGVAILAIDLQGRFMFLNPQALELFGYAKDQVEELIGQHFTKLLDPEQAKLALQRFLGGREIGPFVADVLRKDGRSITVEVSGSWVWRGGERVGALAMAWELPRAAPPDAASELSKLDLTILQLLSSGLSNREIAERVYLSSHTIKDRIEKIMRHFGVSRRTELAATAARQGLV
jgi:PAS domain S-box-containing protein